jgi:hypothetical protein
VRKILYVIVGFVFDLRQQLDFARLRLANHGARLGTLTACREEEP